MIGGNKAKFIDVNSPKAPQYLKNFDLNLQEGKFSDAVFSGDFLFVSFEDAPGVKIFDLTSLGNDKPI